MINIEGFVRNQSAAAHFISSLSEVLAPNIPIQNRFLAWLKETRAFFSAAL